MAVTDEPDDRPRPILSFDHPPLRTYPACMRILVAWALCLLFAGVLHLGLRASFALPPAADPGADDPSLSKALDERAKLLDSPSPLDLVLTGPLVKTNAELASKIRGRVPSAFDGSAVSRRYYRRGNLTQADGQLAFVGRELEAFAFRGWLAAALAPLAIACFAFRPPNWTRSALGSVRSLGLLCLVFVLGPGLVTVHPVSIAIAVVTVVLAAGGFALGGRVFRRGTGLPRTATALVGGS